MSQQNLEIVREAVAAFNGADAERVIALAHPDFEARVIPELSAEPDTYRGTDGIRRYMESFEEAFEDIRFEAERLWDAGEDIVVALRMSAIGKRTKIGVEQRNASVWSVRDGRLARIETYASKGEALRAVGLSE